MLRSGDRFGSAVEEFMPVLTVNLLAFAASNPYKKCREN